MATIVALGQHWTLRGSGPQRQEVGPGHQRHAFTSLVCFSFFLLFSFLPPFPFRPLHLSLRLSAPSQLSSALLFDAVYAVVMAVQELNRSQEIGVKPLSCGSAHIWQHGTSLMNYLRMVRGGGGPAGHAQPVGGGRDHCSRPLTSRPPQYITAPGKTVICGDPIEGIIGHSCSLIPKNHRESMASLFTGQWTLSLRLLGGLWIPGLELDPLAQRWSLQSSAQVGTDE